MKPLSQIMNGEFAQGPKELQPSKETRGSADAKSQTPETERIDLKDIEAVTSSTGIVSTGVRKHTEHLLASKHYIWYYEDEKSKEFFEEFIANLGSSSDIVDWESFLYEIFKDCFMFGRFFCELVFNKNETSIVDLNKIDPKTIDYAKDSMDNIVFDENDRPIGYFITYPFNSKIEPNTEDVPDEVMPPRTSPKWIYLPGYKVVQIKYHTLGNDLYPVGIVEPVYGDVLDFKESKSNMKKIENRFAMPMMITKVGDISHAPTPKLISDTHNAIKAHKNERLITTAYYNDIKLEEVRNAYNVKGNVELHKTDIKQGLWMPDTFGYDGRGSAMKQQTTEFAYTLTFAVRKIVAQIKKYIFEPICKLEQLEVVPTIVFEHLDPEEKDKKPKRLTYYSKAGLINDDGTINSPLTPLQDPDGFIYT